VTDFWEGNAALEKRLERVEAIMAEAVGSLEEPIRAAVLDAVVPGGKLLRPALLLIGSDFGKAADAGRIEVLAAAIEILHAATLAHDDVIDEAPLRRGRPSLHERIGVKEAVLAGDWLLSRCFLLAAEGARPDNARGLARLIAAICASEIGQDLARYEYPASARRYFRTISGKTAALFSLALYAGASEARAGKTVEQALRRIGYGIGMAFQIIDDILDFEADTAVLRKPTGLDIAEGLCTLPLIYALGADESAMRLALDRVASCPGDMRSEERTAAARAAAELATRLGGTERARQDARRFTERSLREVERLPASTARNELAAIADRLLSRAY
jgi:heptaprenyl diphosphate synthase